MKVPEADDADADVYWDEEGDCWKNKGEWIEVEITTFFTNFYCLKVMFICI